MKARILLLSLIISHSLCLPVIAQNTTSDTEDYILVVNITNFDESKNREIFNRVSEEFSSDKMHVENEELSIPIIQDMTEVEKIRDRLHTKYSIWKKPRMILFVGDPIWLFCKPLLDNVWKDVPNILCMAHERMLPDISYMINQNDDSIESKLRPTQEIIKGYNTVALQQPLYIKETLHVIYKLIPDMKRVILISDQRYTGTYTRICIRDVVKKSFPQLQLTELSSSILSTGDLLDSLSRQQNNTGIIYSSWFIPVHRESDTYLNNSIKFLVQTFSKSPVFILADIDPNGQYFAGGHYLHVKELSDSCIELIYNILHGSQPRNMQTVPGGAPYTQLNYAQLCSKGIPDSRYPATAVYVQAPSSFWNKYKWTIVTAGLLLIVIIITLFTWLYALTMKNRTREQRVKMYQGYRRLINNMPILYGRYHFLRGSSGQYEDYVFMTVNHAFEQLFGIRCKEIEGKHYSELIEDCPILQQLHWSALISPSTLPVTAEDGVTFFLDKTVCAVPGQCDVFDIFGLDNTQIHNSWNQAKDYKVFLEGLFDNLSFSILVRDVEHHLRPIYWNKETERLFGLAYDRVVNDPDLLEKDEIVKRINDMDHEVVNTGKNISDICKFEADGHSCYYAIRKCLVTHPDNSRWLISTIWDVTEEQHQKRLLKSLNERMETVLKAARMAVWTYNIQDEVMDCDIKYMIDLTLKLPEDMPIAKQKFLHFVHPDDRGHLVNSYRALIGKQNAFLDEEIRLTDGVSTDWVRVYGVAMQTDEEEAPKSLIGAILNINVRKKVEQDLRQAKEAAEQSNRLKSAFLANMSHEIRTPLNAIIGFSEVMMQTDDVSEKQKYMNIITNNNALLLQLIGDILDLSKIEAGILEFIYDDVDVNASFSELEQSARLNKNNPDIEICFAEKMSELVLHTDRYRLMQIMNNLMTNALKFTCQGDIHFGYRMQGNGMVHFYLSDTGMGIPKEQQLHVFERFVKLDSFKQGTGLGLSICQSIVKKLGGEIGVDSEPGKGSTFWFELPYVASLKTAENNSTLLSQEKTALTGEEKPIILIAEDNPSNYLLYETILKHDYVLLHAWNGEEAVQLFQKHHPHLILMDIKMPVMDGYEATKKIRELSPTVFIIAVTAFAFSSDETHIMENGFSGYIPKPIRARSLKAKILETLKMSLIF